MTNENTIDNSQLRLEKMGIESCEITEKLLSFKMKIMSICMTQHFKLCEDVFIAKVKDTISEQEVKDIYQKAS